MTAKLRKKTHRWRVAVAKLAESDAVGSDATANATLFNAVLATTLRFLDDVTGKDISGNYPVTYNAATPLHKIGIPAKLRPALAEAFDTEVRDALVEHGKSPGDDHIEADDMRHVGTIIELCRMACAIYAIPVPKP